MGVEMPVAELHAGFSSPGATPTDWADGRRCIDEAEVFWLSTVRPDGRPHVTPLLAVRHHDAMYFCTGPDERKAKNLQQNRQCILTTGQNGLDGLDVVVEGHAVEVDDKAELERVANAYESKYGARFTAPEATWFGLSDSIRTGEALLYRVTPTTILGFRKGEQFSQTRWRFA
jgi:nitroimidazol reductase NimA-like FMN-containing flavoprotein (pyridoxamine 5'-phosphate oxidase superfamily)